jgi:hypothetical protein
MLGDTETLRLEEAQAGSDKEYMETGEHLFRSGMEKLLEAYQYTEECGWTASTSEQRAVEYSGCSFQFENKAIAKDQPADCPRFIPNREGQDLQASYSLLHDEGSPASASKQKKRTPHGELHFQKSK